MILLIIGRTLPGLQVSEGAGGHAGEPPEVFPEIGRGGEAEPVGYFAYRECSCLEKALCVEDGIPFYPFHGAVACDLFDCEADMLRGEAQRVGVEAHVPVAVAVVPYECDEVICNPVVAGCSDVPVRGIVDVGPETVVIGNGEMREDLVLVVVGSPQCGLHHPHILLYGFQRLFFQREETVLPDIRE